MRDRDVSTERASRLFLFLPQNLKETQTDFLAKYCTLLEYLKEKEEWFSI